MERPHRRKAKIGDVFPTNGNGDLEIIDMCSYNYKKSTYRVRFINTGYITEASLDKIKAGKVKDKLKPSVYSVGYIGDGEYNFTTHGVLYQRWKKMLSRCYSGNYPTYDDCTVCERWHNFQNFVSDCLTLPGYQDNLSGLHLDKDILVKGNRIYSPLTCQFVEGKINTRFALLGY